MQEVRSGKPRELLWVPLVGLADIGVLMLRERDRPGGQVDDGIIAGEPVVDLGDGDPLVAFVDVFARRAEQCVDLRAAHAPVRGAPAAPPPCHLVEGTRVPEAVRPAGRGRKPADSIGDRFTVGR